MDKPLKLILSVLVYQLLHNSDRVPKSVGVLIVGLSKSVCLLFVGLLIGTQMYNYQRHLASNIQYLQGSKILQSPAAVGGLLQTLWCP